jgi:hypothetical protein
MLCRTNLSPSIIILVPYFSPCCVQKAVETETEEMVQRILIGSGNACYVLELTQGSTHVTVNDGYESVKLTSVTGVIRGPIDNPSKSKATKTVRSKGNSTDTAIYLCEESSSENEQYENYDHYYSSEDGDGNFGVGFARDRDQGEEVAHETKEAKPEGARAQKPASPEARGFAIVDYETKPEAKSIKTIAETLDTSHDDDSEESSVAQPASPEFKTTRAEINAVIASLKHDDTDDSDGSGLAGVEKTNARGGAKGVGEKKSTPSSGPAKGVGKKKPTPATSSPKRNSSKTASAPSDTTRTTRQRKGPARFNH